MYGSAHIRIARAFSLGIAERCFTMGGDKTNRGEPNGYRNDTSGHPGTGVAGRDSHLASQQGMGLWSQWWGWLDTANRVDFVGTGQDIDLIF